MRARFTLTRVILATSISALTVLTSATVNAATFTWRNNPGNNPWSVGTQWTGNTAPLGNAPTSATDILVFAGDVTNPYISTNDLAASPFLLNKLNLNSIGSSAIGFHQIIPAGVGGSNALGFFGASPEISQAGSGGFAFLTPIRLDGSMTFSGAGAGLVTLNEAVSGIANITKNGASTFRFGTVSEFVPSNNTWLGKLTINGGTIRFNNNEQSGRTAVRANPVSLATAGTTFSCNSEMRFGTLTGVAGTTVQTTIPGIPGDVVNNESILITAFTDGTYSGNFRVSPPLGAGQHKGEFLVRGTATQTLDGNIYIDEDTIIGKGATLVIGGTASLAANDGTLPIPIEPTGSVILSGGTIRLENVTTNNNDRLREAGTNVDLSTTLQPVGGGTLILSGNVAGTNETTGRLQLGASGNDGNRAGHLNIELVHRAGTSASTSLGFQSYTRSEATGSQYTTVNFTAKNASATPQFLLLGQGGNSPAVFLNDASSLTPAPVPLLNGLLNVTAGAGSVGWATVTSPSVAQSTVATVDFATYTENGVSPVATIPWAADAAATDNVRLTTSQATPATANDFSINSLKIAPAGLNQTLTIAGAGNLDTTAILHTGSADYTIRSTGGGGIRGGSTRFFHIEKATLNVSASIFPGGAAMVKSGLGILSLSNSANVGNNSPVVVNGGILRAEPGASLPNGELRLRGGVLEIVGGTFERPIGIGAGSVNFSGIAADGITAEGNDRASGGFAAFGSDATVTLNSGATINWENLGFVRSGHALILGSDTATAKVDFTNPINLTPLDNTEPNYNAREIRAVDNSNSAADSVIISGAISGALQQDLLKTGDGTLELTAANTYVGHTQVREGRLLVTGTGSIASSNAAVVATGATLGGDGTVGTILLDGGKLEPGKDGIGTLTTGNIHWRSGTLKMDLGAVNASDKLAIGAGRLIKDVNGTGPYTIDFGGTGEANRTYVLANFGSTTFPTTGSTGITVTGLRSNAPGAALTAALTIVGGELRLTTNFPAATFAQQPQTQRVSPGENVTFSVETTVPGPYTYQWFKNNVAIDGETASTLVLNSVVAGAGGSDGQYKVVVSNGTTPVTSSTATLTVNLPPVATPATIDVTEDQAKAIVIAGTDPNSGDTLTYSIIPDQLPQHGTLTVNPTSPNFLYTPAENYFGPDSFKFKVNDGLADSAEATITLNVQSVNDAPKAFPDTIIVGQSFDIIANDTDIENDTLSLSNVQNGTFGTVARDINNSNKVIYTAGSGFSLSDTFTYTVTDGNGGTNTGTVTVVLENPISLGITAKGLAISGEPDGTVLSKASAPALSEDGRLAFVGTLTKPDKKSQNALFVGNPPVPVIKLGVTTAPNSALTFAKVSAPVMNADGDVGFKGSLTKAPAGTADGIWVRNSAGTTRLVAQGKMTAPGITGATFSKFSDIALPDDGRLIFTATIKGVQPNADTGIWRETGTGTVAAILREGEIIGNAIPDNGGVNRIIKTIAAFGPSEKTTLGQRRGFNGQGAVVARVGYADKSSAILRINNDGSKNIIWRTDSAVAALGGAKIKAFGLPVLADDGTVSVQATLVSKTGTPAVTTSTDTVMIRKTLAGVTTLLAQEGSAASNITGSAFKSFSYPVGADSSRVGFIGTLKAKVGPVATTDDVGIWRHNVAGDTLVQIAREGQPAPGASGAIFTAFKSLAWTGNGNAGTAFVATLKGGPSTTANDVGLWAEDTFGALKLAFREGDTVNFGVNAKTVKSFTILGPVLGALGQGGSTNYVGGYGILATFTDRTTGIVTVWVP